MNQRMQVRSMRKKRDIPAKACIRGKDQWFSKVYECPCASNVSAAQPSAMHEFQAIGAMIHADLNGGEPRNFTFGRADLVSTSHIWPIFQLR